MDVKTEYENKHMDLLWKAQAGIFYHQRLAARYTRWLKWSTAINLLFSITTVTTLMSSIATMSLLPMIASALVAANSAFVLGLDITNKASLHASLAREWIGQFAQVEKAWSKIDQPGGVDELLRCEQRQHEIDAREPPTQSRLAHWAGLKAAHVLNLENPDVKGLAFYLRWF